MNFFSGMKNSFSSVCSSYWHEFVIVVIPVTFMVSILILLTTTVFEDIDDILRSRKKNEGTELAVER